MDERTERVALQAQGFAVSVGEPTGSEFETVRDVPADLVVAYRRARAELEKAREAVVVAAGFDPETAWERLMDAQSEALEQWSAEQDPTREGFDEEIEERLRSSDITADKHAAGQPVITLDEDGNVVRHMPDGTVERVAE